MKRILLILICALIVSCKGEKAKQLEQKNNTTDSLDDPDILSDILVPEQVKLTLKEANNLAELPLSCLNTEYPNKLGQVLENKNAMGEPSELHPAFYGCFDWHSSVHAHWSLVSLLKNFPDLEKNEEIKERLTQSLSASNINAEIDYFKRSESTSYERTYGWAWLLKLSQELTTWKDPLGKELAQNLQPLTDLIINRYLEFLPKLNYPIRVGEHTNTAFGLGFAYDYAQTAGNAELEEAIAKRSKDFYLKDDNCPIDWEPSGYDFLSPCLSEVDIMLRVLPKNAFSLWIDDFMPQLKNTDFDMEVGEVSDRTDGKLVHLDGLNFSRAWVLYALANKYPEQYGHLRKVANKHIAYSFPNVAGDSYEGGHWLGTFAIYSLQNSIVKNKE